MPWACQGADISRARLTAAIRTTTTLAAIATLAVGPLAVAAEPADRPPLAVAVVTPYALGVAPNDRAAEQHEVRAARAARPAPPAPVVAAAVPSSPPAAAPRKATARPPRKTSRIVYRTTRKSSSSARPAEIAPAGTGAAAIAVAFALAQVGKPYVWGAAGPGAYDCSGLVMAAWARAGVRLPHQSGSIAARGRSVPAGQWAPGDVITWPGHVALYIGGGRMVEAAHAGVPVRVTGLRGGRAVRF